MSDSEDSQWTAKTSNVEFNYHRIYPTKVSVGLKYRTPRAQECIGETELSVARAIQNLRDREIAYVQNSLQECRDLLLPKLPKNGKPLFVHPHTHKYEINLSKNWNVGDGMVTIFPSTIRTAVDSEHDTNGSDEFLADQIIQGALRTHVTEAYKLFNGNLLQEVIKKWQSMKGK